MDSNIKTNINLIDNKLKETFSSVVISEKQNDDSFLITTSDIIGDTTFDAYKVIFKVYLKDLLVDKLMGFSLDYYANPLSMDSDLIHQTVYLSTINDILVTIITKKRFNSEYLLTVTETKLPYYDIKDKKYNIYLSVIKKLFKEYNIELSFNEWVSSTDEEKTNITEFTEKDVYALLTCSIELDSIDISSIKVIENILEKEFTPYASDVKINMYNKQLTIKFEIQTADDLINIEEFILIK